MRKKITMLCFVLLAVLGMRAEETTEEIVYDLSGITGTWCTAQTDADGNTTYTELVADSEIADLPSKLYLHLQGGKEGYRASGYSTSGKLYLILPSGTQSALTGANADFDANGECYVPFSLNSIAYFPVAASGDYSIAFEDESLKILDNNNMIPNQYGGTSAAEAGYIGGFNLNFKVAEKSYYLTQDNLSGFTPAEGSAMKVLFDEWTATWDESVSITSFTANTVRTSSYSYDTSTTQKALLVYGANAGSAQGELDVEFDYTNRTIKFSPTENLKAKTLSAGDYYVRIMPNQFYFNGDETKTNGYIQFGPYTMPSYRTTKASNPPQGQITEINNFVLMAQGLYVARTKGVTINTEATPKLYVQNADTEEWSEVCDLEITLGLDDSAGDQASTYDIYTFTLSVPADKVPTEGFAPGNYKVECPVGMLEYAEQASPTNKTSYSSAYSGIYELIEVPDLDLTPAYSINGETVTSDQTITGTWSELDITFAGTTDAPITEIKYVGEYDYDSKIGIWQQVEYDVDGTVEYDWVEWPEAYANNQLSVEIEGNVVKVYMDEGVFTPNYPVDIDGTYKVVIPAGKFGFNGYDILTNEDMEFQFVLDAPEPTITLENATINPLPGEVDTPAVTYTVTIEGIEGKLQLQKEEYQEWNSESQSYVTKERDARATLTYDSGWGVYPAGYYTISISDNVITLTPDPTSISADQYFSPADYYINIPKNVIFVDGNAEKFNATLEYGPYVVLYGEEISSIDPAAGKVGYLKDFELTFDDLYDGTITEMADATGKAKIYKYDAETEDYTIELRELTASVVTETEYDPEYDVDVEVTKYQLLSAEDAEKITEPGKYKLVLESNTFRFSYMDYWGETVYSKSAAYEAEYEIVDPAVVFAPVSIEPAEGVVEKLETVTITFNSENFTDKGLQDKGATPTVYDKDGNVVSEDGWCNVPDDAIYSYKLTIDPVVTAAGEYEVVIPAGSIVDYGNKTVSNNEIRLKYSILAPVELTVDPVGGDSWDAPVGLDQIDENTFIVTVTGGETIEINSEYLDWNTSSLMLWDTGYGWDGMGNNNLTLYPQLVEGTTNQFKLVPFAECASICPITDKGLGYSVLSIPEGVFTVDGRPSPELDMLYTINEKPVEISVEPATDETIYQVDEFILTFSNVKAVAYANNEEAPVVLSYSDPELGGVAPIAVSVEPVEGTTNQMRVKADAVYTYVGDYSLYLPAGAFYYNGDLTKLSEEKSYSYSVIAENIDQVTTVPAQGDLDIDVVGGTFRAVNVLYSVDAAPNPDFDGEITLSINGQIVDTAKKYSAGEGANELGIIFSKAHTENGTYVVSVPRGAALLGTNPAEGEEDTRTLSSSQTFTWNVTGGWEKGVGIDVDPAEGDVASLSVITLTFNEYETAEKNLFFSSHFTGEVTLTDAEGNKVADCYVQPSEKGFNSEEVILYEVGTTNATEITTPGTYTLTVPEGFINFKKSGSDPYASGEYSEKLQYTWTVIESVVPEITITLTPVGGESADDAAKLAKIDAETFVVTVEGGETVEINPAALDWNTSLVMLWDVDATFSSGDNNVSLYPVAVEGTTNQFTLAPFAECASMYPIEANVMGYYYLYIPEGVFTVDGFNSPSVGFWYTIDPGSVEVIDMDTDLNIYSVNGMLIKRNGTAEDLKNLENGIYIVNGKKVYIRK